MSPERVQDALRQALDEAFSALANRDWDRLRVEAQIALALDPGNEEAVRLAEVAKVQVGQDDPEPLQGGANETVPSRDAPAAEPDDPAPPPATRMSAEPARRGRVPRRPVASIGAIADHVAELAPLPSIATQVVRLSDDETSTVEEMARLVAADPALTAKILSTANSAYYHRGQRITTIREALVVLGAREVRSLTVATCVMDSLGDSYVVSTDEFWRFSLTVALLAELLARSERIINGDAFTVGILHGIGLLALDLYWPDGLQEALAIDDPQLRRLPDRERAVFGFTSAEVGAELALRWRLPRTIVRAIANQKLRRDELEPGDRLSDHLIRARIFARFNGLSDGLERSEPRTPPAEWREPPLATSLHRMGGMEGILGRVDAFLGVTRGGEVGADAA